MIQAYLRMLKLALAGSLLLPLVTTFCSRLLGTDSAASQFQLKMILAVVAVGVAIPLVWRALSRAQGGIGAHSEAQAGFLDTLPERHLGWAIVVSAALSLFLELVVIRWQGAVFLVFAFYKNFTLLACFAGLGLGYALAGRSAIPLPLVTPVLAVQFLLLTFLRYGLGAWRIRSLMATPVTEQLNMGFSVARSVPHLAAIYFFLLVVFLLTALAFLPVGQLCGRLMARRENLAAYGFNLLGSLLGVLLMFAVSYLWTPPVVWFGLCFAALMFFLQFDRSLLLGSMVGMIAGLFILAWPVTPGYEQIYSPYQLLVRVPGERGWTSIQAAGLYYQRVYDLAHVEGDAQLKPVADYYELPYRILGRKPGHVAIVGAGSGNDVAAGLRCGAERVDAIEIDPAILRLGKMYHPEKPYDDPRVHAVVNDARTFLRTTPETYDMVVYGLLDSHTLLSHASSVRLDSFVYTVEGLREARARLKPDGIISLSFGMLSDQIGRKIFLMMKEAFGGIDPVCVRAFYDGSVIFLQARDGSLALPAGLLAATGFRDLSGAYASPALTADVSTDDWPFFYMPARVYPKSYMFLLGFVLVLSLLLALNFFGQSLVWGHPSFFLLGAGFMLIETKGITEMGLTFGNTWHVIGIVIAGILLMAFLANACVAWLKIRRPAVPFILLLASLLLGYVISLRGGFPSTPVGKLGTAVILTCPMFFSGMVFSSLLSARKAITGVMAINLLGSMLGGVLEYNSMYFGFRSLYLVAMGLYALAFLSHGLVRGRA